ncbi:MAG TPA: GNAT family N-acetyltransferase [Caulobacteraceae bacterium]|nr:GNAT family N-acetyltransferase [Caulobacteraceae bacterium]
MHTAGGEFVPPVYRADTVVQESGLLELVPEWRELHARASGMAALHPAFTLAAVETAPTDVTVCVVAVRSGSDLVGVWPLGVSRRGGARRAMHPGCGAQEEYAGMLIAPGEDGIAVAREAIAEARGFADVVTVFNTLPPSPLLEALRTGSRARLGWTTRSHVVDLAGFESWDAWLKSKSKNFRQSLGGQRRNLAKLGELTSVQDEPGILPWFFEHKRQWLRVAGQRSLWIDDPSVGERFTTALQRQPDTPLRTYALKLNGEYIAAGVCVVSPARLEYLATVYLQRDDIARFSPGMLVSEDCGRWAQTHGLDLDFRVMDVPYKDRWRSRIDVFECMTAALTLQGVAPVLLATALRRGRSMRRALGKVVRSRLRNGGFAAPA